MAAGVVSARINATTGLLVAPARRPAWDEFFLEGKPPAVSRTPGVPANSSAEPCSSLYHPSMAPP